MGGPLGGILCDTIGWRWCFNGQVPPTILGLLLILWKLPTKIAKSSEPEDDETFKAKLARVDVVGASVLITAIVTFIFAFELINTDVPISYPIALGVACSMSLVLFYFIERRWAKEPIIHVELFTEWKSLSAYVLVGLQGAAQFAVYYAVPIYFQIVSGSNAKEAGLRLVPAVIGNATAGLIAGYAISRTGRYKLVTLLGNAAGCVGYLLILLRWRGAAHPIEAVYIFLGGFASGTNQSTTFIHLAASLDPGKMAIAATALYMIQNLSILVSIQSSTALLHARLKTRLEDGLQGVKHKRQVCVSWRFFFRCRMRDSDRRTRTDYRIRHLERGFNTHPARTDQGYRCGRIPRRLDLHFR
jgi:predicted MFS family arabinose efflux permease